MQLKRFKEVHKKVIHGDISYEDVELCKEEKLVKKANDAVLNLVCPTCFPLLDLPKFSLRPSKVYALDYPKVHTVVWNDLPNK